MAISPSSNAAERIWHYAYLAICALVFIFLIAPILLVVPLSFNAEPYFTITERMLTFDPAGYSLRWYDTLLTQGMQRPDAARDWAWWLDAWRHSAWILAAKNSLIIGFFSTALATVLGTVAALELARSGLDVVVGDSQRIGEGAARRNAGFIGRTLKRSVAWLTSHSGQKHAIEVYRELDRALKGVERFVGREGIDCHHRTCGRFIGANSQSHFRGLVDDLEETRRSLGFDYSVIEPENVRSEIASDRYHGGAVIPDLGSIHPGLYHKGLVERAVHAGVRFHDRTYVTAIEENGARHNLHTSRGAIAARHVVITTNGYTGAELKWHARRVIPFSGFIVATELLPEELIDKVLPQRRTYLDTKMNIDFIRPARTRAGSCSAA